MKSLIYTSPDRRTFDPLALYRKLLIQSGNKVNQWLLDWQSSEDEILKAQAEDALVTLCRKVFEYKPFTEDGGVVDSVVLDTLNSYLEFTEGKGNRG